MYVFTKRHAHRDVYFFKIQIHTFLLFNVLKREVSNVFLYIWTINYSYSYSYSYSYVSAGQIILAPTQPVGKKAARARIEPVSS